jgi:hypothetical protein
MFGGFAAAIGGGLGIFRRVIIMDKLKKIYFDIETKVKEKPMKVFIGMFILFVIAIII